MSEAALRLAKAPIVEAVIDFDCDMPPAFDLRALEEAGREAFRAEYPKFRNRFLEQHYIESNQGLMSRRNIPRSVRSKRCNFLMSMKNNSCRSYLQSGLTPTARVPRLARLSAGPHGLPAQTGRV